MNINSYLALFCLFLPATVETLYFTGMAARVLRRILPFSTGVKLVLTKCYSLYLTKLKKERPRR